MSEQIWTVRELLGWAREWLAKRGIESPRLDAELLLASALGCDRVRLYIDMDKPLTDDELGRFKPLVKRRGEREPVAYILGVKEFYGRPFFVEPGVFIPRPETEILVQVALEALSQLASTRTSLAEGPLRALDLCTGSGAVGVTLAAERKDAQVDLAELADAPFLAARRNAETHAPGRARVHQGDLFAALPDTSARYHAITANPPYIPDGETLPPEVMQEPLRALFGGKDGLEVARRIIAEVPRWLLPGGFFATEIDPSQAVIVAGLCRAQHLAEVRVVKDLAGLDRHVVARAGLENA